jgi:CRP/FNR family transcriptional regulator, anaerobic regulatory protein
MNIIEKSLESGLFFQAKDRTIVEKLVGLMFTKKVNKKDYLLKEGEICKEIFYVQKGLLRVYIINDGKEVNTWFVREGDFITSISSFHKQKPSEHYIDALEDCEIISIKKTTLDFIMKNNHKAALFANNELFNKLCDYQEQASALRFMSAENRYTYLVEKQTEIFNRLSQKHLASYLGVDTTYLSKIISKYKKE